MEFHEITNIFPMMSDEEFNSLKDDIRKNGLIESIWTYKGEIIDGRNRYNACVELDVEPEFREYKGEGSLTSFIVALNLKRRHLTTGQQAMIAEDSLPYYEADAKERQQGGQGGILLPELIPEAKGDAREKAASDFNVNPRYISDAKKLKKEAPDLAEKVKSGKINIPEAKRELRKREIESDRKTLADKGEIIENCEKWNIYEGNIEDWKAPRQYDFIITDPPYPKEYLSLYDILAEKSCEWLKPEGLLIVMCGQSYVDEIYKILNKHLNYYWTAAYLTPGQPTPLRQRQVNTTWKPLLIYTNSKEKYQGKIFGDVFKSDSSEKDYHKWGQSVSGMYDIISKICLPGQYILDPFCGAGTTGIAAIKNGCLFDGLDIDNKSVNIAKGRLSEYDETKNR